MGRLSRVNGLQLLDVHDEAAVTFNADGAFLPLARQPPMAAGIPKPMEPSPWLLKMRRPALTRIACMVRSLHAPELPGMSRSFFFSSSESTSIRT